MYYGQHNPWTESDEDEDEAYDDMGDRLFHERQDRELENRHED